MAIKQTPRLEQTQQERLDTLQERVDTLTDQLDEAKQTATDVREQLKRIRLANLPAEKNSPKQ